MLSQITNDSAAPQGPDGQYLRIPFNATNSI